MGLDCTISSSQQLIMTPAMQQALFVLQLPAEELAEWLTNEIESNPLLELQERKPSKGSVSSVSKSFSSEPISPCSLYEHLQNQLLIGFDDPNERKLANLFIDSIDSKGFSSLAIEDVEPFLRPQFTQVKSKIQHLDPLGVGCFDTREYLLFQLIGKEKSLAYEILDKHFPLFLNGEYALLAKAMRCDVTSLKALIREEIVPLNLVPAERFSNAVALSIVPDLIISQDDDQWKIAVNEELFPLFQISPLYQAKMPVEARGYLSQKKRAAKWLHRACFQRKETLEKIGKTLLQRQLSFFSGEGRGLLIPLTYREVAEAVGLHESTIARAVSSKWVSCPSGVFPLHLFFKSGVDVSSESIKRLIQMLIAKEDKKQPLSDLALLQELQKRGIECARRTIAKYRLALAIPSSSHR